MKILLKAVALAAVIVVTAPLHAAAQADQREVAQQLLSENRSHKLTATELARNIPPRARTPELRTALIEALEQEVDLDARLRQGEVGFQEHPELISRLALVVADMKDRRTIAALARAAHTSPPAVKALAAFGEPAASAVLDLLGRDRDTPVVNAGLITLRLIVEGAESRTISQETHARIRDVAKAHLTAEQSVTTLWRAIDLAVLLNDDELDRVVESLASNRREVIARGVTEPGLVKRTQQHAVDRLAGISPELRN